MPSPLVSVIVVNWNGKEYLKDCFQSLRAQTFSDYEIILVDNGSTDGSVEWIRGNFPGWAWILVNARNEGFSGGNNRGINVASRKYIVLLNNDARAERSNNHREKNYLTLQSVPERIRRRLFL